MIQLKRTWASTARITSGSCTSLMRWSSRLRSLVTSGSSSAADSGARCSWSSTRSVPARTAATTASTPMLMRSSSGARKADALAGICSRA